MVETTPNPDAMLVQHRKIERRDWWLWTTTIWVMILLALAVYSFELAPPGLRDGWWRGQHVAIVGLQAFVAVFSVFALHRQYVVKRLHRELSTQARLMTALETRAELFQKLAILDPLTGLYNRRFALKHMETEIARADRSDYKLSALVIDINDLKQINDEYGHTAGDLALRGFASALRRAVRSSDIAVRMGGDEFLVILPQCDPTDLPRVLARLSNLAVDFRGTKIDIRFSVGWAEHIKGESVEQLLERADRNMYEDKNTGSAEKKALAARDEFRHRQKLTSMGRLATEVAHDFNTLLTVIKGYAELALESNDGPDQLHAQLEEIQKAADRAVSLTGQLLAFSRKQAIEPMTLDIGAALRGMETMLGLLVGKRNVLTIQSGVGLFPVCMDMGQLEQIMMNLTANARDAMPDGGKLAIRASNFMMDADFCAAHHGARPGDYVCLTVSDSGAGMDPEIRDRIFEPFFTTKQGGRGTGLGLAIVYGIVKQNGGYVWVDSELGHGTTISVYLPRRVASQPVVALSPEDEVADEKHGATALVVESFDALRSLMGDFLKNEGYEVLLASSGEGAITLAAEHASRIDLVVVDLLLPAVSGVELAACVSAQHPEAKILYVSGYGEDVLLYRQWLGQDASFLVAPFTPIEFSSKIKELLRQKTRQLQ